jgi:hypothetical protein
VPEGRVRATGCGTFGNRTAGTRRGLRVVKGVGDLGGFRGDPGVSGRKGLARRSFGSDGRG